MTLDQLNALDQAAFTAALGAVFEHSPWVAERAWARRPFANVTLLHQAMCAEVEAAPPAAKLTEASTREQQGAGLDQCTPEEFARLTELNAAYETKFGFPFIVAVRGHTRASILELIARRLLNAPVEEHDEALHQVFRIARFRLEAMMAQ
jgi:2-oxo-4-hydroxy-4-carboxy-5-ureidoimidazoline decarboxylase